MLSSTFAMIKPEAVAIPYITKVVWDEILANKLEIIGAKRMCLNREMAEKLYSVHEEKFFYERLIQHIISGPVIVMKLGCTTGSAIERWRTLMGPSKMLRTLQSENNSSLRARFALSDTRNLVHGADSQQTANYELSLFAPYPKIHLQKEGSHIRMAKIGEQIIELPEAVPRECFFDVLMFIAVFIPVEPICYFINFHPTN